MTEDVQFRIEQEMLALFRERTNTPEVRKNSTSLVEYVETYISRPAKRIRPWLLATTAEAYDVPRNEAVIRIGAATELLHVFALIHDDRIDGETRITPERKPDQKERTYQVLGGDLLHSVALHAVHDAVRDFALPEAIRDTIRRISLITINGQAADIDFIEPGSPPPELSRLYSLYDAKTGYYSFVAPLTIGALMGGASDADQETIGRLGLELGRIYQMRDDVADIRGRRAVPDSNGMIWPRWEFNLLAAYLFEKQGIDIRSLEFTEDTLREFLTSASMEALQSFCDDVTATAVTRCMKYIGDLELSPERTNVLQKAVTILDDRTRSDS